MAVTYTEYQLLGTAVSAYAHELYTHAQLLNTTGIVGVEPSITHEGESFTGQLRWYKPLTATINTASLTDATAGSYTSLSTELASYIKCVRTIGMQEVNLQKLISGEKALDEFSARLATLRAVEENDNLFAVLKGVAAHEASLGAGIVDFDTMPNATTGAYVDLNAEGDFGAEVTLAADGRRLFDNGSVGAAQGERLYRAMGMAWKDYEPEYAYLVINPATLADIRAANLVDETLVTEGNLVFNTIFGGKFRLLLSRASQGDQSAATNVNNHSKKTSFIVRPGAISWTTMNLETPVEFDRNAAAYLGGGSTEMWFRFGFIVHPLGYDWRGPTTAFPTKAQYGAASSWVRKVDPLNLGIIPVFHS